MVLTRAAEKEMQMSRPSIRRTVAGLVLAALLATAAPARATGYQVTAGLQLGDLWSRAWSWLTDLWTGGGPAGAATPQNHSKALPGPPPKPPPGPPPPGLRGTNGDQGSGVDPDG